MESISQLRMCFQRNRNPQGIVASYCAIDGNHSEGGIHSTLTILKTKLQADLQNSNYLESIHKHLKPEIILFGLLIDFLRNRTLSFHSI